MVFKNSIIIGNYRTRLFEISITTFNGNTVRWAMRQSRGRIITATRSFWLCDLVLLTGLMMWIGHLKEIRKLTFRALALRRRESIRSHEGLTLETPAFESLYGGQFTSSTQLIKASYLLCYTHLNFLFSKQSCLPHIKLRYMIASEVFYAGYKATKRVRKINNKWL